VIPSAQASEGSPLGRAPSFFAKLFQGSVVPMPSFSKECLGGFEVFQGVTIDPNPLFIAPNFCGLRRPEALPFGSTAEPSPLCLPLHDR
jgi:hypothetical protein